MTVSTTTNKVVYIGNGIAVEFAVPFPFLEKEHLKVYQLLNDIQTERTDWTIQSGNLVFETAPVSGAEILVLREVPLTQETDYRENAILPAETLERCFDKLTMQVQQLKEKTDRAVTVDMFDDTNASELLPNIKQAVSTAASYANTATTYAQNAANSATTATQQATLATAKAQEVADTLAGKAGIDADNFSSAGKKNIVNLVLPDYTAGISLPISSDYQEITQNGYIWYKGNSGGSIRGDGIEIKLSTGEILSDQTSGGNYGFGGCFLITAGCQIRTYSPEFVQYINYYPLKGIQNNA